jgi:hypothetical protein
MNETVWSNEALLKLSDIRNSHIFLYWCPESQRIHGGEKAANLQMECLPEVLLDRYFFKVQLQALRT